MSNLITSEPLEIANLKTWEEFVSAGVMARELKDMSQWFIGELATGIEKKYGEDSLGKYAREIGVNPKSLAEYRRVVKKWPRYKRLRYMSFSHHQRVLKANDPEEVLEMAHDNDWSIKQLDRYLIEEKSADCPHKYLKFKICELCGKKIK